MMKDYSDRRNQTAMVSVYGKRGILLRLIYLVFAVCWYVLTLGGRLSRYPMIVLCYHGIPAGMRDKFDWQIRKLSKWKSSASSTDSKCREGIRRGVHVTFDDAFANLLDNALPVLERYQIPATIFAVADNLGCLPRWELPYGHPESTEMTMTAEQLVAVSKNPLFRIGSHTLTHPDLTRIRPDQLKTELIGSKHRLEELLGKPIEDLSLPFGSYNIEVLTIAREAGYKRVYTVDARPANPMSQEPVIGRFAMSPDVWKIEFLLTCSGAYTWLYPWRRFIRRVKRWFSLARRNNQMTTTIRPINRDEWQRLAPTFMDYNYHQLWDFGVACAERRGAVSEHIAVSDGGQVLGIADVRIKKVPLLRTGVAYINGGPLVRQNNETDKKRLEMTLQVLVQQYVKKGRFLLRIQPPLGDGKWNNTQTEVFTNMSFDHNNKNIAYRTFVLNLDQSLEEIRKKLDKQWRYNLKQAEKVPLVIKREASKECFDTFCSLYNQFITQKTFEVDLHPEFYARVQGMLSETERFIVTLAELDDRVIAGHVCSNLGDTCVNQFRAMDETAKKNRASYLLQWTAISWAHGHGCRRFDLGGIDPKKNPGVYHFKKGMGGVDVTIPAFEMYPNSWSRGIVHFGERVYRLYRKARKSERMRVS